MINLDAEILMPDGNTLPAAKIKPNVTISDIFGCEQTVRRSKTSSEKEYHVLHFENGRKLFCLPYLAILTWDSQMDANLLKAGDNVLAFRDGKLCEMTVTDSYPVTIFNKKHLDVPKKVKMLFFEAYEDMPFVANEVVIGLRKQLRLTEKPYPPYMEK